MKKSIYAGFTLVELSIVLVIIGLLVGGVLVGRDLIVAARLRATISEYQQFQTAVKTFQGKYSVMPGDLTQQQAVQFNMLPLTRADDSVSVHGDDLISDNIDSNTYLLSHEHILFWQDLSTAGLVEGSFTSATDDATQTVDFTETSQFDPFIPHAAIDGSYWMAGYSGNLGQNIYWLGVPLSTNGSSRVATGAALTAAEAYGYDHKLDDGLPMSGTVRVNVNSIFPIINIGGGTCTQTLGSGEVVYDLSASPGKSCNMLSKM